VTKELTVAGRRPILSLAGFARTAALASFGASLAMFLCAAAMGNQRVWQITALLCVSTVAAIIALTLSIGCLVMLPIAAWRFVERLTARWRARTVPSSHLWDNAVDGPER
jgi:hypothetical protein